MLIPLYPPISITKKEDLLIIANDTNSLILVAHADILLGSISLRIALSCSYQQEVVITYDNPMYSLCNDYLVGNYETKHCIYDCEFDRWLCLTDDGELEWTTSYHDEDIAFFLSEEQAEDMIPIEDCELYAVHTRYYLQKGIVA